MPELKVPVTSRDHILGADDAAVTLVEYGDYQCPYCAAAQTVVASLRRDFSDRLRFVYRHFPLAEVHPYAEPAAETAEFAGEHGRFWQMHDGLFANRDQLGPALFLALAGELGLSKLALRDALVERTYAPRVQEDFIGGVRSGVNGTPSFFINGLRHDGGFDLATLGAAINRALAQPHDLRGGARASGAR
jgi:protein-disulfide isomerase